MEKNIKFGIYSRFVKKLLGLNRANKTLLVMISDYTMLVLSFWVSLSVRINEFYIPVPETNVLILFAPLLALPVFYFFGLYKSLIRYSNYRSILIIMVAASIYTLSWFLIVVLSGVVSQPYNFLIINWLITIFFIGGIRYVARWLLITKKTGYSNIAIYGAGSAGVQLYSAIKLDPEVKVVIFLDDDPKMHGRYIEGIQIKKPSSLKKLIKNNKVSEVLIAIPSASRSRVQEILQSLKQYPISIRILPSLSDMVQGRVNISALKQVKIEDLLRRSIRKPNESLLKQDISNKNVLVTGAGGSIGSELCRQIIRLKPSSLILFEISEFALYAIEYELLAYNLNCKLVPILGDIKDKNSVNKILKSFNIQTIYHAAAYKHVPMVEKNTVAAIKTNIFGTIVCIEAAVSKNVESFVFVSTDKAVRPTNIMGATKRFAELILQAIAEEYLKNNIENNTRISIVRFGNVLGSSGSVIPLFRQQIEEGGPITVTDRKIVRYFMTIKEAAQLVIQAGAMGSKGDIFVLDMGEPIEVVDLAKDMIKLSGMTIKDKKNPDGDIEIIFTGLRPGEKLFEELLIDETVSSTKHKKIMNANDRGINWSDLKIHIEELELVIETEDHTKMRNIFSETVTGFKPMDTISDSLYLQDKK